MRGAANGAADGEIDGAANSPAGANGADCAARPAHGDDNAAKGMQDHAAGNKRPMDKRSPGLMGLVSAPWSVFRRSLAPAHLPESMTDKTDDKNLVTELGFEAAFCEDD